jgi:hypothetical protein
MIFGSFRVPYLGTARKIEVRRPPPVGWTAGRSLLVPG